MDKILPTPDEVKKLERAQAQSNTQQEQLAQQNQSLAQELRKALEKVSAYESGTATGADSGQTQPALA